MPRFLCRLLRHRGHKSLRFWPNWLVVHDFDVSRAKTPFGSSWSSATAVETFTAWTKAVARGGCALCHGSSPDDGSASTRGSPCSEADACYGDH